MQVALPDGYNLNVEEVGSGFPLIVLHGGPGLDHTMFRPYLDALGNEYRLLYVDERGQGRSQRVDPTTLSLEVFARDVDLLAGALELDRFALLGHSFGAIIATWHATELGTATAYVISGGGDSSEALDADVAASLEALGDDGRAIAQSWEDEATVETDEQLRQLMTDQLPFHFHGEPPPGYMEDFVPSP
ncbi:MAG TPA: alpha/beta fold hydrolase, partial [Gaiellaceae bacterium]|nr:alpha/beta fold hydrolase [Gaiellaceae bacterium]